MWARRVLLATLVAAAAMTLPRHGPATSFGTASAASTLAFSMPR